MKKISKIFVALLFVGFLCECQSNDISSSADQSLIPSSSENSENASEESSIKKLPSGVFYFTAICDYMKELSDYRNPDYMLVSTERTGSDLAAVRGEKCYMILSLFDNIQLQYCVDDFYSLDFDFKKSFSFGANIRAYYSSQLNEGTIDVVRLMVSRDGKLGIIIADKMFYYTDPDAISFETVGERIKEVDSEHYHYWTKNTIYF